jgi:hypothetical protein
MDWLNVIYLYSTLKPIAMKKVAKLVTVSFTTRMIVDESASVEIIELSKASINKVNLKLVSILKALRMMKNVHMMQI